jgi:hypothetical protein
VPCCSRCCPRRPPCAGRARPPGRAPRAGSLLGLASRSQWGRRPTPSSPTVATRPTRMPVAAGSRLAAALNAIEHARREAGSQYRDVVVGASGSIDKTPVSSPPGTDEHPEHRVARPFPAAWPSSRTTGPAVGPVSLNSALPRRAGRASAYYRFFGRDCWPQGQLQGWYSAEPAKDAPLLSPRARPDLGDCRGPLAHPHDSERLGPRLHTPASDELRASAGVGPASAVVSASVEDQRWGRGRFCRPKAALRGRASAGRPRRASSTLRRDASS